MSKYSIHEIQCPHCERKIKVNVADSINVTLDADEFFKVRSGKVFEVLCPECTKEFTYKHPLLFHDMEKRFMVQYAPDIESFKNFIKYSESMNFTYKDTFAKDYKYRVVLENINQFIEKVEILSFGLNDIAIEIYKEIFYQEMGLENVKDIIIEFNLKFNKKRLAVYYNDNKQPVFYNIDEETYSMMLKEVDSLNRHNDYIVDRRFILKLFDENINNDTIQQEIINELESENADELRNEAVNLAKNHEYDKALEILLPLALKGDKSSQNDIGVVYEKIKDYENSAKWYKVCDNELSTKNLLKLYDNNKVNFTKEEYIKACNKLIDLKNEKGYLYLSYIYQKDILDYDKAFEVLLKGLISCDNTVGLVFELGYLLEKGIGCKQDHFKSHKCYEAILDRGSSAVVHYNYALQCQQGRGCKQDILKAIKHYEIAVKKSNYYDAIRQLIEIYSHENYKNEKRLNELKLLIKDVA